MSRICKNSPDHFCYICGEFTFSKHRKSLTPLIRKAYELYFDCKVGDQDKSWAPHMCCFNCDTKLRNWMNGKKRSMGFAVPMIWREPKNHIDDCYFCAVPPILEGVYQRRKSIAYPSLASAIRPVPHDEALPIPECPRSFGEYLA